MKTTQGLVSKLTLFALEKPKNRIFLVLLFSLFPFGNSLASVIVCLTTLRKGINHGLMIMLWAILPDAVVFFLGAPLSLVLFDLNASYLLPFVLAVVLRNKESWHAVLVALTALGFLTLASEQNLFPSYAQHAIELFKKLIHEFSVNEFLQPNTEVMSELNEFVPYFFVIKTVVTCIISLLNLIIARGLQAHLFNPGGLKKELLEVRLHPIWVVFAFLLTGLWISMPLEPLTNGLVMIGALPFIIAGLSISHTFLAKFSIKPLWLLIVVFYSVIILLKTLALLGLILIALYDSIKRITFFQKKMI